MTEGEHAAARKPILSVDQQIAHLKKKGMTFELCGEGEAAAILAGRDHYFKLAAYRTLFPKRVGGERDGQYAGLDFGHLVDLAAIDRELRGFLLPMALEVEDAAKTKLIGRITDDPGEDGYSILADYLANLNHGDRNRRSGEVKRLAADAYLGPLVARYPLEEMPAWVYLELASFGALADFYLFCAGRWGDTEMKDDHYLLRRTGSLRNATAHSSAILNGLGCVADEQIRYPSAVAVALEEIGVTKRLRRSKMRNPRMLQMTVLAYAFSRFVPTDRRSGTAKRLEALKHRALENAEWYSRNNVVESCYGFLSRVFDGFGEFSEFVG